MLFRPPVARPLRTSARVSFARRKSSSQPEFPPNCVAIRCSAVLRSCSDAGRLRAVHALLTVLGPLLPNATAQLVNCYAALGHLSWARSVLESSAANAGARTWNFTIRAYREAGCPGGAIRCFWAMMGSGVEPDKYTFPSVLRACAVLADVAEGQAIHREAARRGLDMDIYTRTALVDMYAKSGMLHLARQLFDGMPEKDVVSWNALISGYARFGDPRESLRLFRTMMTSEKGVFPNSITVLNLLPAICELSDTLLCGIVHGFLLRRCWLASVSNGLVDAYCKCSSIRAARRVFDEMSAGRDAISWATMISGYVNNGLFSEALDLFDGLRQGGHDSRPNQASLVAALVAATETRDLDRGEEIHALARREGIDSSLPVATALVTMYAACGDIPESRRVFDGIEDKDVVAWSAAISAASENGLHAEALSLLAEMQTKGGLKPNRVTLLSALTACAQVEDARPGKSVHGFALKYGLARDATVVSALVAAYAKLGRFHCAFALFDDDSSSCSDDVVAWNALINGHAQKGDACGAIETFRRMRSAGLRPDPGTMVGVLPACSLSGGASAHALIIKSGLDSDLHAMNALVDAYAKCGNLSAAETLFLAERKAGAVLWNTMMTGYALNGCAREAVSLFSQLRRENLKPNLVSFVVVLPAVACLAALRAGLALHCAVIKAGFESRVAVGNCLVDVYSKCGRVDLARELFDGMGSKDVVSWNAMISGLAAHGLCEDAVELFDRMPVQPDSISFLAVLSACRHGGLVGEGRAIFESMGSCGRAAPRPEHYACMVDLLGRGGRLHEAWDLIQGMPLAPDAAVWGALLGACRMHSHAWMGEMALKNLVRLEPHNAAHHVVLSNIYARLGRWADARSARKKIKRAGLSKIPGCSWVEVNDLRDIMEGMGS